MTDVDAPARILAIVNGMSTRLPDGNCQMLGGWSEDSAGPRAVEYVRTDLFATSEAARIKAEGEVERLREALEKIEEHPIRTPVAGRPCAGLPGYPACPDIARAALRREPSTALESGKTEGGGE